MSEITTPTVESANIAAIRRSYDGFLRRDVAAVLAVLDPDVEWVHPEGMNRYGLGGVKHGHAGVREFLGQARTKVAGMVLEPSEFLECGDRIVVFGTRLVTSLQGTTARLEFVHSWTMRDGLAVRMEDIFDTIPFGELIDD